MIANQDFKNVFGDNLIIASKRLYKGLAVLKGMMKGENIASNKMPIRLQIEITNKCNYDCIMCNRHSGRHVDHTLNNDITHDCFEKLIKLVNPFYVTLNGLGEPLLNAEIDKILATCRRKQITTSMPCNLSVSKVLNTRVVKCPPNIITFSIHGASKEVFESISRKSNYEKCISALVEFLTIMDRKSTTVRILCALQANNLLEYKNMYNLLYELGLLDNFSLVPVYDYGQRGDLIPRIIPTDREKEEAIAHIDKDIAACTYEKEALFYSRWKNVIGQIVANDTDCCEKRSEPCLIPWFSAYIAANGDVLPCCYLLDGGYVMGNIFHESFDLIWNDQAYKRFRKNVREKRAQLKGCNYCSRDDASRIKKYGVLFRRTMMWKV